METVALPVLLPKQSTLVWAVTEPLSVAAGWVMLTERVVAHPLASVTVQIQVPAGSALAVAAFCTGEVFHA